MKIFSSISMLALALCFSVKVSAQSDLTGKWAVQTVDVPGKMYIDLNKDSMYVGPAMMDELAKEGATDSASKEMIVGILKGALKVAFTQMSIRIDKDGGVYQVKQGEPDEKLGQYDAKKKVITYTDEKSGKKTDVPVEMKNGLVKFVLSDDKDEENVMLWCKKVE